MLSHLVPETKGGPLKVIDRLFEVKPVWQAHRRIMARLHEDDEKFRQERQEIQKKTSGGEEHSGRFHRAQR
jgi:hypothetical protein